MERSYTSHDASDHALCAGASAGPGEAHQTFQRRSLPRHRGMRKGAKTKLKRLALQVLQIQENIGLGPTRLEFTPYPFRFFCPPSGRTPANQGNSESSRAFAPCGCEFPRSKPSESRIEREAASARR